MVSITHNAGNHQGRRLANHMMSGFLVALAIVMVTPLAVHAATTPTVPSNVSPADGTFDISLTHKFVGSDFATLGVAPADAAKLLLATQWQVTQVRGSYSKPVYDSGVVFTNTTTMDMPVGYLLPATTYYWHVRYQDIYGWWSFWSGDTSFKTISTGDPSTPTNVSPANGTFDIAESYTLVASNFTSVNSVATQLAAQWQITRTPGDYSSPEFDSNIDTSNLTTLAVQLSTNMKYGWRVRYQDSNGRWSDWSAETTFTAVNAKPNTPTNGALPYGGTGVSITPTLTSSAFSSPYLAATHKASQWQITTAPDDYSQPVYDSGQTAADKTSITVPSGVLNYSTTYYWRVRQMDNFKVWSGWSAQTSFSTSARAASAPQTAPSTGAVLPNVGQGTGGLSIAPVVPTSAQKAVTQAASTGTPLPLALIFAGAAGAALIVSLVLYLRRRAAES